MRTTVEWTIPWGEGEANVSIEVNFRMSKFVPAKVNGDPDDCHEAEGGELEILRFAFVEGDDGATLTEDAIHLLYDTDSKFRDAVDEDCAEAAADYDRSRDCD